jgi:hypothetical protein
MDFRAFAGQELGALAARLADAAQQQIDAATARLTASFETTIDRLRTDHAQVVTDNERLTAENAALTYEKDDLLARVQRDRRDALIAGLSTAFDAMAVATSVEDVVAAAAVGLTGEFSRVAAFTVLEGGFQLRASHGFDGRGAIALASDELHEALAHARHEGVHRWNAQTAKPVALGGNPSMALAASIAVRGELVAMLYADDSGAGSDRDRTEGSVKVAEILRRHAMLAVERLTVELKATAELRAYAKMLLDEVEYVYEADLAAKISAADRQARMKENVRCAKQIYGQRVAVEGPTAAALLDEHIARAITDKAATPFGQDLTIAAA